MEQRVHELESELEAEQHRHSETVKAMRRQERRMKELAVQLDDDRHSQDKLHEIIEKLHAKLKSYKRHAEETVSAIELILQMKVPHLNRINLRFFLTLKFLFL